MAEVFLHAAVAARPNIAYFFIQDQYVVYRYGANERALDGVHSVDTFPPGSPTGFPPGFFGGQLGRARRVDAALMGKAQYNGALYFFNGVNYCRYDQNVGFTASGVVATGPSWNLPAPADQPDAAMNGSKNRTGFCYFIKGAQYWRYAWASMQPSGPIALSEMGLLPALFAGGVDAAVDGPGAPTADHFDASYLFKQDRYVRFNWVDGNNANAFAGPETKISDEWPGLLEMLAAARAKSDAMEWLARAVQLTSNLVSGTLQPQAAALVQQGLAVHFKAQDLVTAGIVLGLLNAIVAQLYASATLFRYRTTQEAAADGSSPPAAAYAVEDTSINFTTEFLGRSARNRVLVVIHEAFHTIDPLSGLDPNHVPEWNVSPAARAWFGLPNNLNYSGPVFYDTQTAAQAIHNPAAFAAYASHLATGVDNRLP